eukprot:GILK01011368.1.p1 GENE.GILK01011368.1~~GILK01011368.1.p1  ORF type:complete len:346 (-),score=49.53 GILK01011368.1:173-1210(-)
MSYIDDSPISRSERSFDHSPPRHAPTSPSIKPSAVHQRGPDGYDALTMQEIKRRNDEYVTVQNELKRRIDSRQKEFQFLQGLPAQTVAAIALKEQEELIIKLQASWRGHATRKALSVYRQHAHEAEADRIISSARLPQPPEKMPLDKKTREELAAKEKAKDAWARPYDKKNIEELQEKILQRRRRFHPGDHLWETNEELCERATAVLKKYYASLPDWEDARQRRLKLRAEIDTMLNRLLEPESLDSETFAERAMRRVMVMSPEDREAAVAAHTRKNMSLDPQKWWLGRAQFQFAEDILHTIERQNVYQLMKQNADVVDTSTTLDEEVDLTTAETYDWTLDTRTRR